MKKLFLTLALSTSALIGSADEGMWMLTDIKQQNAVVMRELGLDLSIDKIYSPTNISLKDAVVHFDGGCTAEVISKRGLVLTNHHCGYSYIQQHSSVEHDYLTDGFWAMSDAEELPCEGLDITFIDKILDVTAYVQEQLKKDPDPEGLNYLSPAYLSKVAARFAKKEKIKTNEFRILELKAFYGGNKYYLFVKNVYKDVRMVGAPPSSIGKFGADTDNWMWPRHCGDFSLFRIYADKKGNPAHYSKENVPLEVKKSIVINARGVQEGDFTFVMGFPGRNWRYMISDEVEERMQTTNFMRDKIRTARLQVLGEEMSKDPATRIQYASKYASSANYWKNAIGMNEGLVNLKVLDRKKREQEEVLAFCKAQGDTQGEQAFQTIRDIVKKRFNYVYRQQAIYEALMQGTEMSKAPSLHALIEALQANDATKTANAITTLREKGEKYFNKDYNLSVDRKVSKKLLSLYASYIPAAERISIFQTIEKDFGGNINAFVDACFDTSIFGSKERFEVFLMKPSVEVATQDLIARYASSVAEGYKFTEKEMKAETNAYNQAHKVWVGKVLDFKKAKGIPVYPDANSTLRLTYGKVGSYTPKDGATYLYYTTLDGVMEKEDPNNAEFVVPAKLKELYAKKDFGHYALPDGRMPLCFVTGTDNTGGNSGSPVFNAKGELIGTGFDRNYEGLTGDIAYNPALQRAACVDIRYTLFIIDKFAGCGRLIEELEIVK